MGPAYPHLLRRLGYDGPVDAVTAAKHGQPLPDNAQVLVDQLTLSGTPAQARADLDNWFAAGAEMPCLVLTPHADPDQMDQTLTAMAPPLNDASSAT